jgi:hypothetical protein
MRAIAILMNIIGLLVTGLSVPLRAQPSPRAGPCAEIRAECLRAGFVPNGGRSGIGIGVDCVRPIMAGTRQPPRAARPLPRIDPRVVAACRSSNPTFGQGRGGPPNYGGAPPGGQPNYGGPSPGGQPNYGGPPPGGQRSYPPEPGGPPSPPARPETMPNL